jgi:hypothetical protein
VLRPGGLIALFNNVGQPPAKLTEALASTYQRVAPDSPVRLDPALQLLDAHRTVLVKIADGIRAVGASANQNSGSSPGNAPTHGTSGSTG